MNESNLDYVLNFQRHEWKYYVPNSMVQGLIPELLQHMDLDPYNNNGKPYKLYSIYYDTEDWQSFLEKLDGIERRKKFRVRTYNNKVGLKDNVFVEIKEKNKDIILKRRQSMKLNELKKLNLGIPYDKNDKASEEFRYNIIRNSMKPKILIAYDRLAFVAKDNSNARITIDMNVRHAMTKGTVNFSIPTISTEFARMNSVLEIKYKGKPPLFVEQLIKKHNLSNLAISKYAESIISHYKVIK